MTDTTDNVEKILEELVRLTSYPLSQERVDQFPQLSRLVAHLIPAPSTREQRIRAILRSVGDGIAACRGGIFEGKVNLSEDAWRQVAETLLDIKDGGQQQDASAPERRARAFTLIFGFEGGSSESVDKTIRRVQRQILRPIAQALHQATIDGPGWMVINLTCTYRMTADGIAIASRYEYEVECLSPSDRFVVGHRASDNGGRYRLIPNTESGVAGHGRVREKLLKNDAIDVVFENLDATTGERKTLIYTLAPEHPGLGDGIYAGVGQLSVREMTILVEAPGQRPAWWFANVPPDLDSAAEVQPPGDPATALQFKNGRVSKTFRSPNAGRYYGVRVLWGSPDQTKATPLRGNAQPANSTRI